MATATVNGVRLHYVEQGSGTPVVLGHGLCMDHSMFEAQVEALSHRYRVIVPDWRGHGGSEARAEDYSMEDQADDLAALLRHLDVASAHIGGMSMGGMIGLRFALRHPEMTRSLLLIDTDAGPEHPTRQELYEGLAGLFLEGQAGAVADPVMQILFAPPFFANRPDKAQYWRGKVVGESGVGLCHATRCVTRRTDVREQLGRIQAPTLIICGEQDAATTPDKSQFMASAIPGARLVMVPDAGHTSPVEQPELVNQAIVAFLAEVDGE